MHVGVMTSSKATNSTMKHKKLAHPLVDRLSCLPDSLLVRILSLLPTKDAVATGVLSRRWESLWNNIFILDFEDKFSDRRSFTDFINRVLHRLNGGPIDKLRFQFGTHTDVRDVDSWILKAISHKVQEIDIESKLDRNSDFLLPRKVFTCQTLVVLKLAGHVFVKIPSSICFPKLKTLYLDRVLYENDESVSQLISNCLVLENLSIWRYSNDNVKRFSVIAPLLKRLKIDFVPEKLSDVFRNDSVLEIDAPKLQYLDLKDHGYEKFVANLGSLTEANVDLGFYAISAVACIQTLHNVKFLSLSYQTSLVLGTDVVLGITSVSSIKLPHLTHLTLGVNGSCCSLLLPYLLLAAENLEVLKLVKDSGSISTGHSWRIDKHVPRCLLSCLRAISIGDFRGNKDELSMLKYILKNGKVLETLEISTATDTEEIDLLTKFGILQQISKFPRGSDKCEITFS